MAFEIFGDVPLLRNKNIRPNTGQRTKKVLKALKTYQSDNVDLSILVKTFRNVHVLFLYTNDAIYVHLKPHLGIIEEINNNKKCYHLNINEVDESSFESSSKFILYPDGYRLLVLAYSSRSNDIFESLLKERDEEKYISIVEIARLVSNGLVDHRNNVDISLKTESEKRKRALENVDIIKVDVLLLQTYPFTGGHDWVSHPIQVSDEQNDDSRTEQVCSNTGSRFWAYPDTYAARFYKEPTITKRKLLSSTGAQSSHQSARYPEYIDYCDRKRSFETWSARCPAPNIMSQAGFFYTKQGDLIRCFQCGIGLKDFSQGDDPLTEHVRYSGSCPFLPELLGEQRLHQMKEQLQEADPEHIRETVRNDQKNIDKNIKHPKYQSMEARIASYLKWPSNRTQTPQQLADAGLFFSGSEDCVTCYYCGGGLRGWDPGDDPWHEHCRWFPSCHFALQRKGKEFIARVQASSNENSENASEREMTSSMQQMSFVESANQKEHEKLKNTCLEMGYSLADYTEAVKDLRNRGVRKPDMSAIIDAIEILKAREKQAEVSVDPFEQNRRLKNFVYCISCKTEEANMLFLPCAHHSYCVSCSADLQYCPICQRHITDKIRTYLS